MKYLIIITILIVSCCTPKTNVQNISLEDRQDIWGKPLDVKRKSLLKVGDSVYQSYCNPCRIDKSVVIENDPKSESITVKTGDWIEHLGYHQIR